MVQSNRSKSHVNLSAKIRIALLLLMATFMLIMYLSWVHGSVLINNVPFPILAITILLPLILIVLVFWLARNQQKHSWQLDDEG